MPSRPGEDTLRVLSRALLLVAFAVVVQAQSFTPSFTLSYGSPITFGNTYTFYGDGRVEL